MRKLSALSLLAMLFISGCQSSPSVSPRLAVSKETVTPPQARVCATGQQQMQTTLWFGLHRPDGSLITENEWQSYLNDQVTPRFRDGLSVYNAEGQWLGGNGKIAHEPSKALMLVYKPNGRSDRNIEQLRLIFRQQFDQESVMRIDDPVCVSF